MIFQRFAAKPGLFGPFWGLWAGIGPRSGWFRGNPRGFPGNPRGITGGPPAEAQKARFHVKYPKRPRDPRGLARGLAGGDHPKGQNR